MIRQQLKKATGLLIMALPIILTMIYVGLKVAFITVGIVIFIVICYLVGEKIMNL